MAFNNSLSSRNQSGRVNDSFGFSQALYVRTLVVVYPFLLPENTDGPSSPSQAFQLFNFLLF